jgi:hypothetical protein
MNINSRDWFGEHAYTNNLFEGHGGFCDGFTDELLLHQITENITRIFNGNHIQIGQTFASLCELGDLNSPLTQTALHNINIDAFIQIADYYGLSDTVVRVKRFYNTGFIDCSITMDPIGMARIFASLNISLLEHICRNNHLSIVIQLLHEGYPVTNRSIQQASRYGHTTVVGTLLRWNIRHHLLFCNNAALLSASIYGHVDTVQLLLAHRDNADPQIDNSATLRLASANGHTNTVRVLLEDGRADPRANNQAALLLARANGHTDIEQLLIEDGRVDDDL